MHIFETVCKIIDGKTMLFLCNPYHQLSAIKDIVSYSLVFYWRVYIFETVCKIIDGKIYLLRFATIP